MSAAGSCGPVRVPVLMRCLFVLQDQRDLEMELIEAKLQLAEALGKRYRTSHLSC